MGFCAAKDHFRGTGEENIPWFEAVREAEGPDVDILHDAPGCGYSFERLRFGWFEEPLDDRDLTGLQTLYDTLEITNLAPEALISAVSGW